MLDLHLVKAVIAAFLIIATGLLLIKWNPKEIFLSAEYNMHMDYDALMSVINTCFPDQEEAIRIAIRDFKKNHLKYVHEEKVQQYVKKLERALMERTLEICLS